MGTHEEFNNKEETMENAQQTGLSFSNKTEEYLERIRNGSETIEKTLEGVEPNGAIYKAIKERFYKEIPSSCRDAKNNPFPFPVLEDFLTKRTLSTNEEENKKNQRVRTAILYFSAAEWEEAEKKLEQKAQEQKQIDQIRSELGAPEIKDELEAQPLQEKEENLELKNQEILLEKTISLPERERLYEQEAIGDLNGSYQGFVEHLLNRNLVSMENGEIVWLGEDKKVVFVGDILGDRTPEGLKIYEALLKLKEQANNSKGDVVWLSGNHENMFNAVLSGFSTEFGVPVDVDMQKRLSQYSGNLELAEFLPTEEKDFIISEIVSRKQVALDDLQQMIKRKEKTLQLMQSQAGTFGKDAIDQWITTIDTLNTKLKVIENINESTSMEEVLSVVDLLPKKVQDLIGSKIIEHRTQVKENFKSSNPDAVESIKQQKLIEMYDDTLYVHTNLTKDMVDILFKNSQSSSDSIAQAITNINTFYQTCLASYIDGTENTLSTSQKENFNKIRDIFISTSSQSRINFSEDPKLTDEEKENITNKLKKLGVNLVIHGHNDEDGQPLGTADLPIVSIDRSAYKSDNPKNFSPTSAGAVSKNGTFSYF